MKTIKTLLTALVLVIILPAYSQADRIQVHDPVMIKECNTWYLFCTGMGISVWSSADMKQWKSCKPVFNKAPDWAVEAVEGYKGHTWAPDISYHKGKYYLYYSVSAFGKNTSCIGCLLYTSPSPRDRQKSRMESSA